MTTKKYIRIEIHLTEAEVVLLDRVAKSTLRSRKNLCETVVRSTIDEERRRIAHVEEEGPRGIAMKAIEYSIDSPGDKPVLILDRIAGAEKTVPCAFCGERHIHGWAEGHRIAHCTSPVLGTGTKDSVTAPDGTVLHQKDGYILRNI